MYAKKTQQSLTLILHLLLLFILLRCTDLKAGVAVDVTATPLPILTQPPESEPISLAIATPPALPTPLSTQFLLNAAPTLPALTASATTATLEPAPPAAAEVTSCSCGQATCPCGIKHVVIISIDGLRPDAIDQADTLILDALRARGAYSPVAQAVLPSVTLVNHASMLGGMSPAKHGIYWNSNDPDLGKVKGPTVFSLAHEAGLSTAMVVGKPKLEHLVLPNSVENYKYAGFTDLQVTKTAITVIKTAMPNLLFIHLPDVDTAGHALGWMSLGQLLALNSTDSLIGEILATLETEGYLSQTLLIVTSDHGGSGRKHGSNSVADTTIPWLAVGPGVPAGVTLQSEIVTYDTAATASYALGLPIPESWDGRPVWEIFEQPVEEK